jgi:hypothetical protein
MMFKHTLCLDIFRFKQVIQKRKTEKFHALLRELHAFGFTAARWFVDGRSAAA